MNVQELFAEVATAPVVKRAITNHAALNEAYDYGSAFSRGMRIDLNGLVVLLISLGLIRRPTFLHVPSA